MVKNILVGVDGSAAARHAARFALSLGEQTGAKVTLLFVLQPPQVIPMGPLSGYAVTGAPSTEADIKRAHQMLDEMSKERPGVTVEKRVEVGSPADTICEQAQHLSADLIVLGARGLSAGTRWLLGSVSDRVVHHAHCPVTVYR